MFHWPVGVWVIEQRTIILSITATARFPTVLLGDVGAPHGDHPDSKAHGANMGLSWVLSAPDGPMLAP